MKRCSNKLTDNQIDLLLAGAELSSYFSDMDSCYVIRVKCAECGALFEEELGVAKGKISGRENFACIQCDHEAQAAGFLSVLTVFREAE